MHKIKPNEMIIIIKNMTKYLESSTVGFGERSHMLEWIWAKGTREWESLLLKDKSGCLVTWKFKYETWYS